MNIIISHLRPIDGVIQTNEEHQQGVAHRAESFANIFGMGLWGLVLGLLHDRGKEQAGFQKYIRYSTGIANSEKADKTAHAYVGALLSRQLYPQAYPLLSNAIAGHHRGLYDSDELKELLKREVPKDVSVEMSVKPELTLPKVKMEKSDFHHLGRMLFSCLVDADRLDTEAFMSPGQAALRGHQNTIQDLCQLLESHLINLEKTAADTTVNSIRREVQGWCREKSGGTIDFYSLTVPTGGGKTLASVLWALHHAVKNHLQRIIIAIPYTSIIVQTAATLKAIFGEENVLEHHSSIDLTNNDSKKEMTARAQLATENWDYPIIVTTNVQLFESLFSNHPSDCRKLHNIAQSVLILDEVQTLPLEFLRPIVDTLKTLNHIFGTSILFTTASQPTLSGHIRGTHNGFEAIEHINEIVPTDANLHIKLKRVDLDINDTPQSYDEIAAQIAQHDRVLCIVNTRRDAKELFDRLPKDEGTCLHLSRMMCPKHIKEVLKDLKCLLKDGTTKIIKVVATQLIEAGVDIDFPVVYRQQAGLDSILQAAGRCNREGRYDICTTHVFSLEKEHALPRGFISDANSARKNMVGEFDWFSVEAISEYFRQRYARINNFDKAGIADKLYKLDAEYEEAANCFHLIDEQTRPVIVNWRNSMSLVDKLKREGPSYSLMKQLAQYSVSVRQHDFQLLLQAGAVEEVLEGFFVISSPSFYDEHIGLKTDNQWLEESFIL